MKYINNYLSVLFILIILICSVDHTFAENINNNNPDLMRRVSELERKVLFFERMRRKIQAADHHIDNNECCVVHSGKMPSYKKENVTIVHGTVIRTYTSSPPMTGKKGLHIEFRTSSEDEYIIHVCPQWYADENHISFEKGDLLTVSGAEFKTEQTENNIYAATIINRSSYTKIQLREQNTGKKMWAGGGVVIAKMQKKGIRRNQDIMRKEIKTQIFDMINRSHEK